MLSSFSEVFVYNRLVCMEEDFWVLILSFSDIACVKNRRGFNNPMLL